MWSSRRRCTFVWSVMLKIFNFFPVTNWYLTSSKLSIIVKMFQVCHTKSKAKTRKNYLKFYSLEIPVDSAHGPRHLLDFFNEYLPIYSLSQSSPTIAKAAKIHAYIGRVLSKLTFDDILPWNILLIFPLYTVKTKKNNFPYILKPV